jgi:protein-L-isoaspartate O-methyltransferase
MFETAHIPAKIEELAHTHEHPGRTANQLQLLAKGMLLFQWTGRETLVEVGTGQGLTAVFLGRVANLIGVPLRIVSIDELTEPHLQHLCDPKEPYTQNVQRWALTEVCVLHKADPSTVSVAGRIGMVIVNHTYRDSIGHWVGKLAKSGCLAADSPPQGFPGSNTMVPSGSMGQLQTWMKG